MVMHLIVVRCGAFQPEEVEQGLFTGRMRFLPPNDLGNQPK